jgi:hypothetical protein
VEGTHVAFLIIAIFAMRLLVENFSGYTAPAAV